MVSVDIPGKILLEAAKLLDKQLEICEKLPDIRFNVHMSDEHEDSMSLVCKHPDPSINSGCCTECDNCSRKEERFYKEVRDVTSNYPRINIPGIRKEEIKISDKDLHEELGKITGGE